MSPECRRIHVCSPPCRVFPFLRMVRSSVARRIIQEIIPLDHFLTRSPSSQPQSPRPRCSPHRQVVPIIMAEKNEEASPPLQPSSKWYVQDLACRLRRWSLSKNSFQDTRTFFKSTGTNDVRPYLSTTDKRAAAQHERDLVEEHDRSLMIISTVVRPSTIRSTTRLIWTLTRGLCFAQSVWPLSAGSAVP